MMVLMMMQAVVARMRLRCDHLHSHALPRLSCLGAAVHLDQANSGRKLRTRA
jgi:hypothetical protein